MRFTWSPVHRLDLTDDDDLLYYLFSMIPTSPASPDTQTHRLQQLSAVVVVVVVVVVIWMNEWMSHIQARHLHCQQQTPVSCFYFQSLFMLFCKNTTNQSGRRCHRKSTTTTTLLLLLLLQCWAHRAVFLQGLHASWAVVAHTAPSLILLLSIL